LQNLSCSEHYHKIRFINGEKTIDIVNSSVNCPFRHPDSYVTYLNNILINYCKTFNLAIEKENLFCTICHSLSQRCWNCGLPSCVEKRRTAWCFGHQQQK
jgi:hypothetical protein